LGGSSEIAKSHVGAAEIKRIVLDRLKSDRIEAAEMKEKLDMMQAIKSSKIRGHIENALLGKLDELPLEWPQAYFVFNGQTSGFALARFIEENIGSVLDEKDPLFAEVQDSAERRKARIKKFGWNLIEGGGKDDPVEPDFGAVLFAIGGDLRSGSSLDAVISAKKKLVTKKAEETFDIVDALAENNLGKLRKIIPSDIALEIYKRFAGEVEARNAEERMNMDRALRREIFPLQTQDRDTEEQIFRYTGDKTESRRPRRALNKIMIERTFQDENGVELSASIPASKVVADIDARIDSTRKLVACLMSR
jgi:hypothetical protein